ncbi:MAG: hypothetical protein KQJ78_08955 [Deltaproteobacteria bacterium]|nr:hypothetical protein [Deltaproteobacteria bacterium]
MKRSRSRNVKASNYTPKMSTEEWLSQNPAALIECPNQPGNLKLSRNACMKRHLTANEPRYANIGAEPFHVFVFKMNLVPCRNCEIGAALAAEDTSQVA